MHFEVTLSISFSSSDPTIPAYNLIVRVDRIVMGWIPAAHLAPVDGDGRAWVRLGRALELNETNIILLHLHMVLLRH